MPDENKNAPEPVDYGVPEGPSNSWGDGDALMRPDGEDFDRVNDWTFDGIDVIHPGYDNQTEADADKQARARFLEL